MNWKIGDEVVWYDKDLGLQIGTIEVIQPDWDRPILVYFQTYEGFCMDGTYDTLDNTRGKLVKATKLHKALK